MYKKSNWEGNSLNKIAEPVAKDKTRLVEMRSQLIREKSDLLMKIRSVEKKIEYIDNQLKI
ncbi:MAG: hypothetical protein AABY32_00605 [Nanoarchaeota archaeon]